MDKRFLDNFAFGRLRTSSEDFGLLRKSSEMIVSSAKSQNSQDKNLTLISQKRLAGIVCVFAVLGAAMRLSHLYFLKKESENDVQTGKQ